MRILRGRCDRPRTTILESSNLRVIAPLLSGIRGIGYLRQAMLQSEGVTGLESTEARSFDGADGVTTIVNIRLPRLGGLGD